MKRKGFTLSEILVALAIVGVVAAISIPNIHRVAPDKDKAAVLKVFKTVNEINEELINNPTLYRFGDGTQDCDSNTSWGILNCTNAPLDNQDETYRDHHSGVRKYPQLLADNLNLSDSLSVSGSSEYTFTTSDGLDWKLTTVKGVQNPIKYTLEIDTHNPQRMDCVYDNNNCRNPRKFRFEINDNGLITADDKLTEAYLLNPDDLSSRTADLKKASEL